ncbi:MAG: shikimate dehydrogenase [Proteobacteria bacterium]|nr:shikimate dehydrogenase [Pseudomonadota bacterium]
MIRRPGIRAGVMGWPVAHSLSPRLHGYWLARHGIDGRYDALEVAPDRLAERLAELADEGIAGVNLTLPHKQAALGLMASLSPAAQIIGAVNTVVVGDDGSLAGDNTDAFGFMENLRDGAPRWSAASGPAVIIGAGGAARAVCHGLLEAGAPELRIVNRTPARAESLAAMDHRRIKALPWAARAETLEGAALLVNTTTLGMAGQPALDLDLAALPPEALVTDIVYAPLETPLLAAAGRRGNPVVDGLGMLLHQARPGFAAWFGVMPEVTPDLRAHVVAGET